MAPTVLLKCIILVSVVGGLQARLCRSICVLIEYQPPAPDCRVRAAAWIRFCLPAQTAAPGVSVFRFLCAIAMRLADVAVIPQDNR